MHSKAPNSPRCFSKGFLKARCRAGVGGCCRIWDELMHSSLGDDNRAVNIISTQVSVGLGPHAHQPVNVVHVAVVLAFVK